MSLPDPARWLRLSPLVDDLLDLPPAARPARLAQLQQTHPDLADELASLLADGGEAQSDRFLTGAVSPEAAAEGGAPGADASLAGQRLGAYVLEVPLGQGGGGSVWRARREDGRFDGAVAIKLLHLSLVGRAGAERFKREGQILARLTHPHIARLLDAGVTPGGQPYLVLELVQGQRIDRHCDQHRLGLAARLALFADVLLAVAHAHTHGVIHRDLKPGNILVTDQGQVKLLDFGIAKLLADEADTAAATALTHEGGRALTPDYAAPEQLQADGVTTATDVYALGVLLYQLLTGRHPTAPAGAGAAEVMRATLAVEPLRPSRAVLLPAQRPGPIDAPTAAPSAAPAEGHASASTSPDAAAQRDSTPQRLAKALQGDLDTIVLRALQKRPAERYPTVAALAEDLRRHQAHEPVLARPDALAYRARKFVRRHRGAAAAGALVSLAIVAGVAGTVWQARQAQQQRVIAEQQRVIAEQQRLRAEQQRAAAERQARLAQDEADLTSAMGRLVAVALGPVSDKPVLVADVLDRGQAIAERQFANQPRVKAHLLRALGIMWAEGGDWVRTESMLQAARVASVAAGDVAQTAQADCILAIVSAYKGDFPKAQNQVDAGVAVALAQPAERRSVMIECLTNRSSIADAQGRYGDALADIDAALKALGTPRLGEDDSLFDLRIKRAQVLSSTPDMARAVAEYDSLLVALKQRGELDITAYNPALNNFANVLLRAGQPRRADEVLRQLLARQQGPGAGRPREPAEAVNHVLALTQLGRLAEAGALADAVLAQPAVQVSPYVMLRARLAAAELRCDAGDRVRCAQQAAQVEGLLAGKPGGSQELRVRLQLVQARLALMQGRPADARAIADAALVASQAPQVNASRRVLTQLMSAEVALAQGQPTQARQRADQAVADARQAFAGFAQSRPLGLALRLQGQVALAAGDVQAAHLAWQAAVQQLDAALGPDAADARDARLRLAGLPVPPLQASR